MAQAAALLRAGARAVFEIALPPRCPGCGSEDVQSDAFCRDCWEELDLLGAPACSSCGIPLTVATGEAMQCGACLAEPPLHAGIYAAVRYGELPASLAMRLKYGRKTGLARRMAALMARQLPDNEQLPDPLIVPIPLHRLRLWHRGFNQAVLIGAELARLKAQPLLPDALIRTRRTRPLKGLDARQRKAELKGAIVANPRRLSAIQGRNILLIDDVHTSGATSMAALTALKAAGADKVAIAAFARVID